MIVDSMTKSFQFPHLGLSSVKECVPTYVWLNSRSNMPMFCLKKIISQPRGVQNPPFLIQMMLTHYTLRSVLFRPHEIPHVCLKMAKRAIFITFCGSQKNIHLKYGSTVKNLTFTFLPQYFWESLYGGAHISSGDFNTHRDGHNHRHRHRHPGPADFSRMSKNLDFFLI